MSLKAFTQKDFLTNLRIMNEIRIKYNFISQLGFFFVGVIFNFNWFKVILGNACVMTNGLDLKLT